MGHEGTEIVVMLLALYVAVRWMYEYETKARLCDSHVHQKKCEQEMSPTRLYT